MSDRRWDEQFKQFLLKTREDVKTEAHRLLEEVRDPEKRARVKENLHELGTWARRMADDVGGAVEKAVKKAEDAFVRAAEKVGAHPESRTSAPSRAAETPRSERPSRSSAAKSGTKKTRSAATAAKKKVSPRKKKT